MPDVQPEYLTLRQLAVYSGLSHRTLRTYVARTVDPLPCYRLPGKILVKRAAFDEWIARFQTTGVDSARVIRSLLEAVR